ncbi:MAG TPA: NAD(P)/FAD-dependent oxidoreductase [Solirubrobacterales bacterium]|nr:NAD(P)/FAD-dependent oxidoreductase [Solirubrobacterales bacterium]
MTPLGCDAALGKIGLPAPLSELAARDWDAVVVGGGHNGLTAAAYLARAGRSVLVLERQERIGGACTLEQPFPDPRYLISPCAYVVGLLDGLVIRELELERHGYRVLMADPNLWCPLPDGGSVGLFIDHERTAAYLSEHGFSERDIRGLNAYEELFQRLRRMLRTGSRDTWVGSSPTRAELEELLGHDDESIAVVFEESIAETLDRYLEDERMKHALFGQGVIGAFAGPRDPGTASVRLMHHQGDLLGHGPVWGYVVGGMGRVSFAIAEAANESGATLAAGVPVARILPGEGVEIESGELIRAPVVISNADPKRTLAMLGEAAVPVAYRERIESWRTDSPVVKLNAGLHALPAFRAAGGEEAHRSMVSITPGLDAAQGAADACRRGEPSIGFAELYFQSAYDPSVAPPGRHTMSVFAQYAPYEFAEGDWESRRMEVGERILDAIAAYAPDVHDCVEYLEVLGPPDIERRIGLSGGHIFQGEALPEQMWDRRFDHRTPIDGLYLCGAATHPAGSVIALNGRNAAMAVIEDAGAA